MTVMSPWFVLPTSFMSVEVTPDDGLLRQLSMYCKTINVGIHYFQFVAELLNLAFLWASKACLF